MPAQPLPPHSSLRAPALVLDPGLKPPMLAGMMAVGTPSATPPMGAAAGKPFSRSLQAVLKTSTAS